MTNLPDLGPRGEGWVAIQLLLLPLVVIAGLLSGNVWGSPLADLTTLVGLGLMAGGAALVGRGLMDLGGNLTPVPHPRADAQLVETGIYGLVRHPLYAGLIATAVGWSLVSASLVALLLSGVLTAFFDLKSRREEAWLIERYADYPAYRAGTKRFVPWVY